MTITWQSHASPWPETCRICWKRSLKGNWSKKAMKSDSFSRSWFSLESLCVLCGSACVCACVRVKRVIQRSQRTCTNIPALSLVIYTISITISISTSPVQCQLISTCWLTSSKSSSTKVHGRDSWRVTGLGTSSRLRNSCLSLSGVCVCVCVCVWLLPLWHHYEIIMTSQG